MRIEKRGKSKKAQLTLLIIMAIAIVIVLVILFLPRIKTFVSGPAPQDYVQGCIKDATKEALDKLTLQGGSLEPENYILYQGDEIEYVCYTNEFSKKCIMQKPFLRQDIEAEIDSYVKPKSDACLQDLKKELENKGYSVSLGNAEIETSIRPLSIFVSVRALMTITKQETSKFEKFNVDMNSNLYDLLMIASSISNWEARYGDSDSLTYMLYYPNIQVEKKKQGDGTTIYILTNRLTQEKFQFASRSLVAPAGYSEVKVK